MGKLQENLTDEHIAFIRKQHIFFVSTAPISDDGHINLSPKGLDSFRIISVNRVAYIDFVGSGNETSAHILENGRITFMFCAFEGPPNILRLYGKGHTVLPVDKEWEGLSHNFTMYKGARQLIVTDIHHVQTSCGFGVPLYKYTGERDFLFKWVEKKGEEGLENYKQEKNRYSLDGLPTALNKKIKSADDLQ